MAAKSAPQRSFGTGAASRISGVPIRTVDFWARSGIVQPSIAVASGIGSDRQYSLVDLYALRALAGNPLKTASVQFRIVEAIRKTPYTGKIFVPLNAAVELCVDMKLIRREVDEKVGKER